MKSMLVVAALGAASALGPVDSSSRPAAREVARVQSQLDSAFVALSAADVSGLSAAQLARRFAIVATLRGYRDRGVFPHNYDFTTPTPYFIDRKTGTLCAVAFLMESTGRRDMVNRIAAANNNVWVPELAADTAVVAWLDREGLTLDEAALIQEPYMIDPGPAPTTPQVARYNNTATVASVASFGAALFSLSSDPSKSSAPFAVGALVGIVGIAVGRTGSDVMPDPSYRRLTVAAGAASLGIAALRHFQHRGALRQMEARKTLDIQPTANISEKSAGLTVALRF
jgi:hypothetical protein